MIQKVAATLARHRMIEPGDTVVVGVSGGVDSVVLLHVLLQLASSLAYSLRVCYVHHGLRAAADAEVEFVAALAHRHGLPFAIARVDVPAGTAPGDSRQAVARQLRYRALAAEANRSGARRLAVGHHRDDHLETVLMRFIAGGGPDGLAGIAPVRGRLIRPLIAVTAAQIQDYAQRHNLAYRLDESNLDRGYLRNRIRLELLPYLEAQFNPQVRAAIDRLSRIVADETSWLEGQAAGAEIALRLDRPLYASLPLTTLAAPALARLALPLQRRVLRRALWRAGAERSGFAAAEATRALIRAAGAVDLPEGVRARRHEGQLYILPRRLAQPTAYSYELPLPGTCAVPEAAVHLQALVDDDPRAHDAPWWVWVPTKPAAGHTLTIRNTRAGDRVLAAGPVGTAKPPVTRRLRDLLRVLGVPLPLRPLLPLVCNGADVLAITGYYPRTVAPNTAIGGTILAARPMARPRAGGAPAAWDSP